ncbi:GAF domain-containing protein, partial [archaeon]
MPMSLISMVDLDRIWLASRIGLDNAEEFPRDIGFCSYTILEDTEDVLVVRDLTQDPRFANNPLVAGPTHLRFYAGAVLVIEGQKIGSLCLVDYQPHPEFTQEQAKTLREIANVVEGIFEQRRYRTMDGHNDTVRMTLGVLHSLRGPLAVLQEEETLLGGVLQEYINEETTSPSSTPTTPN